ncbi:hypothetical protein BJ875DRAFT_481780 [Amylocarpus encephaloides]|uniref:Uncharacterized protein n=1 Tax=Amylocarpus encephaloides TaxID=45428 RepID=A0A9P8C7N7_9HELO|nr:hypothetical protein BJ875DRAFT_481780 [Amylocarpus encephaloides]
MATKIHHTSTPPPSTIHAPETPRFGTFGDDYQPYSPRKSSRVLQRARAHTPPSHNLRASHPTPPSTFKRASATSPSSPQTASKKKVPPSNLKMDGRRVSGALDYNSTASAAAALGLPTPTRDEKKMDVSRSVVRSNGMLPTPAKTPTSRPHGTDPAVRSVARNLFPSRADVTMEEVMPKKNRGGKKIGGFTLDSFEAEDEPITIFTDSRDQRPEPDMNDDNPFVGPSNTTTSEATRRANKRRRVNVVGEGELDFHEVDRRDDGIIYVFRGKRIFKPYSELANADETGDPNELSADASMIDPDMPVTQGRITRSSIKPRLLFPSHQQLMEKEERIQANEEEEADTDYEDSTMATSNNVETSVMKTPDKKNGIPQLNSTPPSQFDHQIATPGAPRFAPYSPPSTTRTTRSKKIGMNGSPNGNDDEAPAVPTTPTRGPRSVSNKVSPFDGWQRTKVDETKATKKREANTPTQGPSGKRIRN